MQRVFEYREHWLVQRTDTPFWYVYWCRPGSRQVRRRSTGTKRLEEAKQFLIEFVDGRGEPQTKTPCPSAVSPLPTSAGPVVGPMNGPTGSAVPVLDVLSGYVKRLSGRPSHEPARYALKAWTEFCMEQDVVYVHELTLPVQERFVAWRRISRRTGCPISNGTMNRHLDVLRASFYDAWRRGELASFPYVRLLPKPSPRDRFLSGEEVQRLLAACDEPHLRRFVLLALHTLQRPSAILSLRVEQVDLVWNRINFLPTGGVQSNKRKPIVPITSTLRPELEQALKDSVSGFVVEFGGNALKKVRRSFRTACKRAAIRNATPGVLRHTGATLLAAAGVSLREVSGMLGHTTSRITEEVYAKRRPEFLAEAARTLDRLFPADTAPTGTARR